MLNVRWQLLAALSEFTAETQRTREEGEGDRRSTLMNADQNKNRI